MAMPMRTSALSSTTSLRTSRSARILQIMTENAANLALSSTFRRATTICARRYSSTSATCGSRAQATASCRRASVSTSPRRIGKICTSSGRAAAASLSIWRLIRTMRRLVLPSWSSARATRVSALLNSWASALTVSISWTMVRARISRRTRISTARRVSTSLVHRTPSASRTWASSTLSTA